MPITSAASTTTKAVTQLTPWLMKRQAEGEVEEEVEGAVVVEAAGVATAGVGTTGGTTGGAGGVGAGAGVGIGAGRSTSNSSCVPGIGLSGSDSFTAKNVKCPMA
ncbi:hypothetical protein HYV69_02490 [Candidatus Uhrbacteria bacterium]|nr:hypothetical protein [Candidatus Uhrbacteria bacterium]